MLYPRLKVDLNTCIGGSCSLTPTSRARTTTTVRRMHRRRPATWRPCRLHADADCPGAAVDTIVQLTNTSEFLTKVMCFYMNTNGHCSNSPTTICTDANFRTVCPLGGLCVPGWQETDFHLDADQASADLLVGQPGALAAAPATTPGQGNPPQFNEGSIPPVLEVPFTGELLCIQVDVDHRAADRSQRPQGRGDDREDASATDIDARKYNAIGIKAIEGRQDGDPGILNIGGPDAEYGVFNDTVDPPRFAAARTSSPSTTSSTARTSSRTTTSVTGHGPLGTDHRSLRARLPDADAATRRTSRSSS